MYLNKNFFMKSEAKVEHKKEGIRNSSFIPVNQFETISTKQT